MTDIVVPTLGESITEATVAKWYKKPGDTVAQDEPLVELETDKVAVEVNAPAAGVLGELQVNEGETVQVGAVIGSIGAGDLRSQLERHSRVDRDELACRQPCLVLVETVGRDQLS